MPGALAIGTNEISLVQLLGIMAAAFSIHSLHSERISTYLWILFAGLLVCSAVMLLAPSNSLRIQGYEDGRTLLPALPLCGKRWP